MPEKESKKPLRTRIIYFRILSVFLALLLLGIAEIGLRIFRYGGSMQLFVDHRVEGFEDYQLVNPFVGLKYFHRFKATETTNDIFLKEKPKDGFRIFVLGSSTIYGFPYEPNLMASRILHKRLKDAYPAKNIEVVNTSITAINTVTLKDFARQIMKHEPDALVIYAGHNEFYGAYGIGSRETFSRITFIRELHFKMMNLRLYQWMQSILKRIQYPGENDQKGTLMKRIVDDQEIVYDSEKYSKGIAQFQKNMDEILSLAGRKNVPVFLCDLVSNVRDIPPFGDAGKESQSAVYNYERANELLFSGDTISALNHFYKAKDLDPVRFRASEDLNEIIYKLGKEKDAILLPVKETFSAASPGGLIGNNLLTEHVHPNISGQFLLADVFYTGIVDAKIIDDETDALTEKSAGYYQYNWGYTELDSIVGDFKVKQLKSYWPYKPLDSEERFRDKYKPTGVIQNMAFRIITDPDASVEIIHDELGMYYENSGNYVKAMKEFKAMAYMNPYWPDYLNKVANALFNLNDLYAAEGFLRESLKYSQTFTANLMLGEVEFIKHDYDRAMRLFENAYKLLRTEEVNRTSMTFLFTRLFYLYDRYGIINNRQKIQEDLVGIGYSGDLPSGDYPFEYSSYIPYNIEADFRKIAEFLESNIDSAQYYLERCLMINDCPIVNLYLGDVLYEKQNLKALNHYLKAQEAYDEDPDFLIRLFYAYFVSVNKTKATEVFNRLKYIEPSNNQISRLQQLLDALPD